MTRKMSLLVSELTGKIIRFVSAVKYGKEIINHSIVVNKVASDTANYFPSSSNTDFTQYWVHEDDLESDLDSDRIDEVNTI